MIANQCRILESRPSDSGRKQVIINNYGCRFGNLYHGDSDVVNKRHNLSELVVSGAHTEMMLRT